MVTSEHTSDVGARALPCFTHMRTANTSCLGMDGGDAGSVRVTQEPTVLPIALAAGQTGPQET